MGSGFVASAEVKVTGRVRAGEQFAATGELRRRILIAFAAQGIEIPYARLVLPGTTAADPGSSGLVGDDAGSSGD